METPPTLQVRVELNEVQPTVWRRIWIAADTTLDQLHLVLQGAMGWENMHLYGFRQGNRRFSDEAEPESGIEDESQFTIGELLSAKGYELTYDYDFGDDWEHTLKLERSFPGLPAPEIELPKLIDGANACPPEDCGGPWTYPDIVQRVKNQDPDTLEWLQAIGVDNAWTPESFDVELAHAEMMEMIESGNRVHEAWAEILEASLDLPNAWSPLEEQLTLTKLHACLQEPRWQDMFEFASKTMSIGTEIFLAEGNGPETEVPGYADLIQDHVAYDLVKDNQECVIPFFLSRNSDLAPGMMRFLLNMVDSAFGPFRIEGENENGELQLFDLAVEKSLTAHFSASPFTPRLQTEVGDLLLARVVPYGDNYVIIGQALTCPCDADETEMLLHHLAESCKSLGGDPDNRPQLLQSAMPQLVAFWLMQTRADTTLRFPLTLMMGEEWNPGESRYIVPEGVPAAAVLNQCQGLDTVSDNVWAFPNPAPDATLSSDNFAQPIGWVQLFDNQLLLWAGGKLSMKALRATIKKADFPTMRHISTRYGLDSMLPVVEFGKL